ncbi:hypothetical protein PVOR_03660 [Paenibacillus vortex V453]|uniref:Uncharacterized protein n=1 Tax=Paenibacillus vortex V453 TaxID=715225 RepID=A0A2R9T137_9BACL|nr:hypothetical protein [Paenibacillus vortex]EFU43419.1 hypothetical protein PVOR_03660 [Paenibacillus vortex V453]
MKRLSEIEPFKNAKFFVKFTKSEYVDDLLNGELFMNPLSIFIKQEIESKQRGQGDKYEGAHVFRVTNIKIIDPETEQVIATAKQGIVQENYGGAEDTPIFCFTVFSAKDFEVIDQDDDSISIKLNIEEEDKKNFLDNFGDKAVILPFNFVELLSEDANNNGHTYVIKQVKYDDYEKGINSEHKKLFDEGSFDIVFWKDSFFEFQREARFAIFDLPTKQSSKFKMRNLRSYCGVLDAKKFFDDYYVKIGFKKMH